MRWICKDDIEECLTQAWRDKANAAKAELMAAANTEERKAILKKGTSSSVWREYYELLPENLKKKCWYCEAAEIRSDMPVDHFRPKNKVEEESGHDGYWWLAFDWENYRCACTFCNSRRNFEDTEGGKACKFPLCNPESRAFSPEDDDLLQQELPDFLDPFNPDDEKLLWFDNDGVPVPKPDSTVDQERKVNNSIDIFHLQEKRIVRERNKIRIEIQKLVNKLRKGEDVQETKSKLKRMVRDTEKLSRTAAVYLRGHKYLREVAEILQID
jgi:uncharacterized protein (TIGR02646 family)